MSFLLANSTSPNEIIQRRLMTLAGLFLFLYSVGLTLSPAVRIHSWAADYRWQHWIGFIGWLVCFLLVYRSINRLLPDHDPYLIPASSLLTGWGILTIFRLDGNFGLRQTLWLFTGVAAIYLLARFPNWVDLLRRYKYIWLSVGLALTGLTFIFGRYPGGDGPRLWLGCCGVFLQPSEPLKLLLIIYLAAYLAGQLYITLSLGQLLAPTLVLGGAVVALLIAQRDLGTAALIIIIYTIMVYMASSRKRVLLISVGLLAIASIAGYSIFSVIRVRVDSWVNPWLDPGGNSYQLIQSFLAIATGRVFGTGPGLGNPGFIPVAHSDFIAASISEESGLLGLTAILLLIGVLVYRSLLIAMRAGSNFHRFLASGLGMYIGIQSILIIGGNLRMLPLTGVTLPFVSYGGSSLLTSFTVLGLLLIISNQESTFVPELPHLKPYLVIGGIFGFVILGLGLTAGWWAVVRSDDLQFRSDNLRWTVHSRYVTRGTIFDRANRPISVTEGEPGSMTRTLLSPQLGTTIGYSDPLYGKGGLEASLDGYLTGLQGNAASKIWLAEWIYGQPPVGLDVRLTLDLNLQNSADEFLAGKIGAAVVINAQSGEVLALSSQPSFNPNELTAHWEDWRKDPRSPLLNRVTQGQYPLGTIMGPFLFAAVNPSPTDLPIQFSFLLDGTTLSCSLPPVTPLTWDRIIAAGCPGALVDLGQNFSADQIHQLNQQFGFFTSPEFELETPPVVQEEPIANATLAALGQSELKVSPLQLVLAVAQLSNHGSRPSPRLALAVNTPHQGWIVLPGSSNSLSTMTQDESELMNIDGLEGLPVWEAVGRAQTDDDKTITWYLSATLDSWPGSPLAQVVILEEDNPQLAVKIGRNIIRSAINPD